MRDVPGAADDLRRGRMDNLPATLRSSLDTFVAQYGTLSSGITGDLEGALPESTLVRLVLELAARPEQSPARPSVDHEALVRRFIDAFSPEERDWAQSLLDLARSSYRLRDDDNIHLGRIEAQVRRAVREAAARAKTVLVVDDNATNREILVEQLSYFGIHHDTAANATQALNLAASRDSGWNCAMPSARA